MQQFELLGSLVASLHADFQNLFYLLLPVFFAISVVLTWFKGPGGGVEFTDSLRRAFVATLLMIGFGEITDSILMLTSGLAQRIDDMSSLDALINMAAEKAESYSNSSLSLLEGFNDLIIATVSFVSYVILYVARYVTLALYHFSWAFLTLLAPFLLLFHVFSPRMTLGLFRSLIEIASWRVVWSVLSAILAALPFGDAYAAEGTYLTIMVMNFVIALCMVGTPFVVHALVGSGFTTVSSTLAPAVSGLMLALPSKLASTARLGTSVSTASGYGGGSDGRSAPSRVV